MQHLLARPSGRHGVLHCRGLCPTVCRQATTWVQNGHLVALSKCVMCASQSLFFGVCCNVVFMVGCAGSVVEPMSSPGDRVQGAVWVSVHLRVCMPCLQNCNLNVYWGG
jgi:hypothetical protein